MIQFRTMTEHSGRRGLGTVEELVALAVERGDRAIALTDTTTFGHVAFERECLRRGVEPIFGLTREDGVVLLATREHGIRPLYEGDAERCAVLLPWGRQETGVRRDHPLVRWMMDPASRVEAGEPWELMIPVSRPNYVRKEQGALWQLSSGSVGLLHPKHLLADSELTLVHDDHSKRLLTEAAEELATACIGVRLPRAGVPSSRDPRSLFEQAAGEGLRHRLQVAPPHLLQTYRDRLARELEVVADKGFQGYFEMVAELTNWARMRGIVPGPGRGSACGSILCWALGITEIDPIRHGLLFERFLDPSRPDLPDVDLDFPEDRREEVFAHLSSRWGAEHVARLGSTLRRGGKAALADGLRALRRPLTPELRAVAEAVEVRLAGEEGPPDTLAAALDHAGVTDPEVRACCALEGLVSAHGRHAAGVVISPGPLADHVRVTEGVAEADLHDAEALGLVKLDCLGLRTLSVIDGACRRASISRDSLPPPHEIAEADLRPLREGRFAGIFQFEGASLQNLARQVPPDGFDDVALLTAVARPGPLQAGTGEDLRRARTESRLERSPKWDRLPLLAAAVRDDAGLLVYQEQVMALFRGMGFDWPTVAKIRKAMAKSQGRGGMEAFRAEFLSRGVAAGHPAEELDATWDALVGCGAYLFNKSHAVAYALVSCWCSLLKARHPEAFYAAALDRARDVEDGLTLLREARAAGLRVTPFDPALESATWTARVGELVGGYLTLPGVGEKRAQDLIRRRREGRLTEVQRRLLEGPTIYDEGSALAEARDQMPGGLTVARCTALGGGTVLARVVEIKCLDWTTPKAVKRYGQPRPGRERSWIVKVADEEDELELRCTGRLLPDLEPTLRIMTPGQVALLDVNRFEGDGRWYLRRIS